MNDPFKLLPGALAGLHPQSEAGQFALKRTEELAQRAYAKQGIAAFENTKRATAIHEAGHCVVAAAHGWSIRSVWIKQKRFGDTKQWIGRNFPLYPDGQPVIMQTTLDTSVADDLDMARNILAGVMAEMMFDHKDYRHGSSIDEIVLFNGMISNIVFKTEEPFEAISMQASVQILAILKRYEDVVKKIADELQRKGTLRGRQMQMLLQGVQLMRPEAKSGVGYQAVFKDGEII